MIFKEKHDIISLCYAIRKRGGGAMNAYVEACLKSIRKSELELQETLDRKSQRENGLAFYNQELDELVAKLRAKHGYYSITEGIAADVDAAARLEKFLLQNRPTAVLRTVDELVWADEGIIESTVGALKANWGVEVRRNDNVSDEKYAKCVHAFVKRTCEPGWLDEDGHAPEVQGNGYVWVREEKKWDWQPCISVGVKTAVLERLDGFLEWAGREIERLSGAWAAKYVDDGPESRQRALFEALKKYETE